MIGFGRSDKPDKPVQPVQQDDYTYAAHVEWLRVLIFDHLDLTNVTLVCQDWGGLLGLRLVGEHPERFRRVLAANTSLALGDAPMGPDFDAWLKFSQEAAKLPIGGILSGATSTDLPEPVHAGYEAPFPDESFKAGARRFPALVPASVEDPAVPANRAAWKVLGKFERPFLTAFSDNDPMTKPAEVTLQDHIPGGKGQSHTEIKNAGHFLQEDQGEAFAKVVNEFIARS